MTTENQHINTVVDEIVKQKGHTKKSVIPILQAIQDEFNYLPEEALRHICETTEITPGNITGVASFYSQFRMVPAGRHMIKVCVGTACHVKGAMQVYDAFKRHFKLSGTEETDPSGTYTLEKVSCLGCCTLAPVVQVDDVTYGHVTSDKIESVLKDFESQVGKVGKKSKFRNADGTEFQGEIRIGLGSCCVASGSQDVQKEIERTIAGTGINLHLKNVGCVGMCHQVPLVEVIDENKHSKLYAKVKPNEVADIISTHFKPKHFLDRLKSKAYNFLEKVQSDESWEGVDRYMIDVRDEMVSSFLDRQLPVATEHRGVINPLDMDEYRSFGGFEALRTVLKMDRHEVIRTVKESGLRGRGGAGFLTGLKWELVEKEKGEKKYLICNGDEGDPGAFMDRMLLESYPYRVIEGMLIAAFAVQATDGYFYIRAEYPLAVIRIRQALINCREQNLLGENILDSNFNFDIQIYEGAGAFVCGEETALMASIEGNRGFPTIRPPFPAQKGLWGYPTLINNTETFAQVSYIIRNGNDHFSAIGTEHSKGTKVFSLAGKVNRGGLIEVPMGITIRQIVEEIGGGVQNGKKFKAVQVGGPSGGCIPASLYDTPIDYQSLIEVGAMMGSGGLVVLDEDDCMVDIARYFLSFTQNESCGKCTFCRVGTKRMLDILNKITSGKGTKKDLDELKYLADWTKKGSLCNLGKSAPNPVLTTLQYFHDEYEAHIEGRCPAGKCTEMITYSITDDCIGCTKCAQKCPVDAIKFEPHKKHTINTELCIKCDACRPVCPVDAVIVR
ncbi:NAD(P)H-dependent oxidoreductase subunit E [Gaoshiqia sediminis]|uniref:NAD(P)H-dependent oxidoreductase subunit E n=1 Tax=Gaoshiqia sediminis TaxID=2986998 RepID=A0AA41Y9Z4_9BACT|nr:NAD(P)H-dependent oxidoreductase subunit E [Gaoshiqia sediminis]MCW0482183.1 NAD(P)H-dependent oxidoreductase subunit E [Gaoshiqia sediminis]